MPCEKIKRITRVEILANRPNNRHKDILIAGSPHFLLLLLLLTLLMLKREGDLTGG
jgi:hypothetical protein